MTIKRRGCTTETREKIQSDLQDWVRDPNGAKVYWMNGMAGTGKTTIAYSLCEWLEANKLLGANFFCSRTKKSCRDVSRIVPTIACQLARYSPAFRLELCKVLAHDIGASKLNVVRQFEKLVKDPLLEVKNAIPEGIVVVIDALDECTDNYGIQLILEMLMRFTASLPIKFFVASRPEQAIYEKMNSSSDCSPSVLRLHDIEESIVEGDINKYLKDEFSTMSPPPSDDEIKRLSKLSGKLFIYAATVVRFVLPCNNSAVNSSARLKMMLATDPQATNGSRSVQKYKELDKLYTMVVAAAFTELLEEEEEAIRLVLWTTVCAKEAMAVQTLASLLALSEERVLSALQPLRSVLHVSEHGGLVSTLHASFPDYMLDRLRSGEFYCDKAKHNHLLSERCFEVMKGQLRFNICNLKSSSLTDRRVPDLNRKTQQCISPALFYACQHWGDHLQLTDVSNSLRDMLVDFLSRKLLFWMEVLNLRQYIRMGASILRQAEGWLLTKKEFGDIGTRTLVADAKDFVARFAASGCTLSTPHIYISALPLCSKASLVYTHYWGRTKGLIDMKGTAIDSLTQAAIAVWKIDSEITTAIFSPDGTHIASGSADGIIRIWDSQTGHVLARTTKHRSASINTIAFSADGARIVSGSGSRNAGSCNGGPRHDCTVHVWDARTGESLAGPFEGHRDSVNSVAFSPDGVYIVSGSEDCITRLWNSSTGEFVLELRLARHKGPTSSVAFSLDGNRIYIASSSRAGSFWSYDYATSMWGARTGNTINMYDVSVAISPEGDRIVAGSIRGTLRIWDTQTGNTMIGPWLGHTGCVESVAFSPDGALIASGSGFDSLSRFSEYIILVWNASTGDAIAGPFEGHTSYINSVAFSPDGTRIVSSSNDGTIRLWDVRAGKNITGSPKGHADSVNSVAFSPDGAHIVSSSDNGGVRLWDARTGSAVLVPFHDPSRHVKLAGFTSDGGRIITISSDAKRENNCYTAEIRDARNGDTVAVGVFNALNTYTTRNSVAFSPDGACIVSNPYYPYYSGTYGDSIQLWEPWDNGNYPILFEGHARSIHAVAFSADGACIASGSDDGTIQLWDVLTGQATINIGPLGEHTVSTGSTSSPDGARIRSDSDDGTRPFFEGYTEFVTSVAFSPDGARIAGGGLEGTIQVWNTKTGSSLTGPLKGDNDCVTSVAFSPNGTRIVSGSGENTHVWDAETGDAVAGPFVGRPDIEVVNSVAFSPDGNHVVSGFSNGTIRVWDVHSSTSINGVSRWQDTWASPITRTPACDRDPEASRMPDPDWSFTINGWITCNDELFLWVPPDLHSCFPLPPHPFAISREGSIQVENWNGLMMGENWSLCYIPEEMS